MTRPHVLQQSLDAGRLLGAGDHAAQTVAEDRRQTLADVQGPRGIALGLLLDHPLEHAVGKGHPGGLDRLKVDRRQKFTGLAGEEIVERTEFGEIARTLQAGSDAVDFEKRGNGRGERRDIQQAAIAHEDRARPIDGFRPHAPDQQGLGGIVWQNLRGAQRMRGTQDNPPPLNVCRRALQLTLPYCQDV